MPESRDVEKFLKEVSERSFPFSKPELMAGESLWSSLQPFLQLRDAMQLARRVADYLAWGGPQLQELNDLLARLPAEVATARDRLAKSNEDVRKENAALVAQAADLSAQRDGLQAEVRALETQRAEIARDIEQLTAKFRR